jgi:photosystem II protein
VSAQFVDGKPQAIESVCVIKSPEAWDRLMRFMEQHGETDGLVFAEAGSNCLVQIKKRFLILER